jgi:hypothetical protein
MKMPIRFLLVVGLALSTTALFAAAAVDGTYKANGKDGKLAYVLAKKDEPFSGKPVTMLVFTEKDASKDSKPDMHAQFGDLGDALVVRLSQDGDKWQVIGSELAHSALKHSGVSASGIFEVKDVKIANGEISGHLMTDPKADIFGEPIAIDLHFHVKQP